MVTKLISNKHFFFTEINIHSAGGKSEYLDLIRGGISFGTNNVKQALQELLIRPEQFSGGLLFFL